jgi:hypothetical protein
MLHLRPVTVFGFMAQMATQLHLASEPHLLNKFRAVHSVPCKNKKGKRK